jgi:cell division protein FtsZ
VLLSIQGGSDLGLFEINEAAQLVSNSAAVDANIIFGAVIDDALGDEVRVTVIAAGLDENRNSHTVGATSAGTADSGGSAFSSTSSFGGFGSAAASAAPASTPGPASNVGPGPAPGSGGFATRSASARSSPAPPSAPSPPSAPEASRWAGEQAPGSSAGAELGSDDRVSAAVGYVGVLSAPVPEDAASPETAGSEASRDDAAIPADASYSSPSYSSISRPAHAELGKTFDVATTRRRPVVFEEDDDLDVPDFLK